MAQARHADLIRRARAGQLQPELESGRRHERRSRLAIAPARPAGDRSDPLAGAGLAAA